ncbi:MAG: peptidoglycan editing factor PgeF [Lachnospiraceae bacterium]|nr:peptidoglycan editing factor PgeF [Lachnospiraceae bacterium]
MDIRLNAQSKLNVSEEAAYVTFPGWNVPANVHYGYSSRLFGLSKGIYASMNLGLNRGDDADTVRANYRRICKAIGIPAERVVFSKQTHLCNVKKVTAKDAGNGFIRENSFSDIDALMTDETGLPLVIFTSDCVPIFLYDPGKRVIALVHAGWRGTVSGIARETVLAMKREYGSDPKDIVAAVGPSICRECFEIGPEVAEKFQTAFGGEVDAKGGVLFHGQGDRFYADLWRANEIRLTEAGVTKDHITMSGLCTMCRPELFFSHRATNGLRGSNAGFLMMEEVWNEEP